MATDHWHRRADKHRRKIGKTTTSDEIPDAIARKLKALYDTVVEEPVPDRFTELLDQLDKKKSSG